MNWRRLTNNPAMLFLIAILLFNGPISALLSGGIIGFLDYIMDTVEMLPAIVIGLSFHEFAHAKVATLCGDNTPYYQGRVTLDPRAHIDLMGLISLLFIHFGWGRPVQVTPYNFRNRRRDSILVGLAGVTMNLAVAVTAGAAISILAHFTNIFSGILGRTIGAVLINIVYVNISLMMFNLLPVPPLDGFGVITDIFKLRGTQFYNFVYYNSSMILMLLIFLRIPSRLLSAPVFYIVNFIMSGLFKVGGWYYLL